MRFVPNKKFYGNVSKSLGEDEIKELYYKLLGPEPCFKTLEEAETHWREHTINAIIAVAKINGCVNEEDVRACFEECLLVYLDIVRDKPWLLGDVNKKGMRAKLRRVKETEVYPRYREIEADFAKARRCHNTTSVGSNDGGGFMCYCDERLHDGT